MELNTIFIANLAEISLDLVHFMTKKDLDQEISEDHAFSERFIFSLTDNSLLITPHQVNVNFFQDSLRAARLKNVTNLSPRKVGESICQAVLDDQKLFSSLTKLIKDNQNISLISYAGTAQFFKLVDTLKKLNLNFQTPEIPLPKNRWTNSFFGSKSGFVQTTSTLGPTFPPPPDSVISATTSEVVGLTASFLEKYPGVVLKTNRGLAGAGLKIIDSQEVTGDKQLYIEKVINSQPYWQNGPIIIEQFIPPDMSVCGGAPNIELQIAAGEIKPLYVCSMRMTKEGVFHGVEFGKGAVPDSVEAALVSAGKLYGQKLLALGYNGFFELDFVAGIDGRIYPIESNLRRTGGTHAYELALNLFGPNALQNHYFVTDNHRQLPRPYTYDQFITAVSDLLLINTKSDHGLIPTIVSTLAHSRLGYIVCAADQPQAYALEQEFLHRLH